MKFSYNWLKELVNFKESPEKLAELLNLHSFEVETVERVGGDWALDAKIPTNRISDAGNHQGLAKEIGAILGEHKTRTAPSTNKAPEHKKQNAKHQILIKIAKPELCPRYTAQVLEIRKPGSLPKRMRERLETCGFRSVSAVVDITNYVMLETGQPLHAFDLNKVKRGRMTIRESRAGEKLVTLDDTEHRLPEGAIVIEDAERLIDLAGIMGGANSAVSENTQKILLQAAAFDSARIYRATRALHFSSEAARIYSAGSDPDKTRRGLERAVELFAEIGIAEKTGELIDIYPQKAAAPRIVFRPAYADRIIGENLGKSFYKTTFKKLGFGVEEKRGGWIVKVPTQRRDLQIEEDLVEEAVRIYGYKKLAAALPESVLAPAAIGEEVFWERRTGDFLSGAGFAESHLHEFCGGKELEQFLVNRADAVELENPMNPETQYLCPRILIKYVSSGAENSRNHEKIKIFGTARSFKKKQGGVDEHQDLVVCLAQKGAGGEEEFYQLKGVLDQLFEALGVSDYWYDDKIELGIRKKELGIFHPYRAAQIKVGDEKIGNMGEIHPVILENIKSKARIVAAEIDFEKLWRIARAEQEFLPIGKYPAIIRDIAVVVPENTKADEVQEIIENIGGKLLADSDLFDYFQDEQMRGAEGKSLAFHLVFQSPERTLKDEEVNEIVEKITKALEEKGWEIRK